MHDLKKCPFCGGEAYLCASTYDGHINHDKETLYFVKCSNCHLKSAECLTKDGIVSHKSAINYVTYRWNSRPVVNSADSKSKAKRIHVKVRRKKTSSENVNDMEIKFKPCPVCGKASTVSIEKTKSCYGDDAYKVGCSNCNTFLPSQHIGENVIMFGKDAGKKIVVTDSEATRKLSEEWNTRIN